MSWVGENERHRRRRRRRRSRLAAGPNIHYITHYLHDVYI